MAHLLQLMDQINQLLLTGLISFKFLNKIEIKFQHFLPVSWWIFLLTADVPLLLLLSS